MKSVISHGVLLWLLLSLATLGAACDCGDDDDNDSGQDADDDADDDVNDDDQTDDDSGGDDDVDDDASTDDDTGDDDVDDDTTVGETFRFIVMTDPNIVPPETNEFSFWWNDRLDQAVEQINAEQDIQFVLILGDMAADLMEPWMDDVVDGWEVASALAKEKLAELTLPYYIAPGDKDYTDEIMLYEFSVDWADWAARDARLREIWGAAYPGTNPWNVLEHEGVRFFLGNSAAGPRLYDANGMTGSFGEAQMTALENELAADRMTIFFSHHPGVIDYEENGVPTLYDVLSAKAGNVAAFFHGHLTGFQKYEWAGVEGYGLGGINQSYLYYAIVEVNPATGEVKIVNEDQLAFPVDWQEFQCEPGQDTAGGISSLVDTVHSLFISEFKTDFWLLNLLLANADVGNTPMPLWVLEDNGNGTFDIEITQAHYAPWTDGEWVVIYNWGAAAAACEVFTMGYDDPCLTTVDANISYDLLQIVEPWGTHANCGIQLLYDSDFLLEAKMGEDSDGNLSFPEGQISLTLDKDSVVETMEQFVIDSYCTADTCGTGEIIIGDNCSAAANGHTAACASGTLAFEDIPSQCDTPVGDNFKIPMRIILAGMDIIPDAFEVDILLKGWGHQMTLAGGYETNFHIESDIFGWASDCPVQMDAD